MAAHSLQCRDQDGELPVGVPRDVLAEESRSPALVEDFENPVEQPAVVVGSLAASGNAVGLARVSASDNIHASAPRCSVEAGNVIPDRRRIQGRVFHPRHEAGRGVGFPLDVTHGAGPGLGGVESKLEAAGAGTEGQDVEGTCSHITPPPSPPGRISMV